MKDDSLYVTPQGLDTMRAAWRDLNSAISYAAYRHMGQLDKAGEPYIWHVLRVGISLLPDLDAVRVGLLHDIFEDTPARRAEVDLILGRDPDSMADLLALTRREDEEYGAYIERIALRPTAAKVKLADLRDNSEPSRFGRAVLLQGKPWGARHLARYRQAYIRLDGMQRLPVWFTTEESS